MNIFILRREKFTEKIFLFFSGIIIFSAVFFIYSQVLAEETDKPDPAVVALQTEVKAACDRLSSIVGAWEYKLPNIENYVYVRAGVASSGFQLPSVLSSFSESLSAKRRGLNTNCSIAQTSQTLDAVQTAYTNIKNLYIEEVAVKALGLLDKLNGFYGKAKTAGESRDMVNALNSQAEFALYLKQGDQPTPDGQIILAELKVMGDIISAINANMPEPVFYSNIFLKNPTQAAADISAVVNKISANTSRLNALSKSFSKTARPTQNIFTLAAKAGIAPDAVNALLRAKYTPIYENYKLQAKKLCESLKKNIGSLRPRLILNSESIGTAYPNISSGTLGSIKKEIDTRIGTLDALTTALGAECAGTFNFVSGKLNEFNSLNLTRVILPTIGLLKSFDKHVAGANRLNIFYQLWNNSQDQMEGALVNQDNPNKLDRADFSKFGGEMFAAYPIALQPLVTTRKEKAEKALDTAASSGKEEDLKSAKTEISAYAKDLGIARKQFGDFQKRWWQFINQAAVEGIVKDFAKEIPSLAEELRAAKMFTEFNKKRESYYNQAKKLVEARTKAILEKQSKVDAATGVPEDVRTSLAFKTKTDAFLALLNQYLNEVILTRINYFDLRASLVGSSEYIGLKNFGYQNYIRAQDTYIRVDKDYKKVAILEAILNGEIVAVNLNERITALESDANKAGEAQALRSAYNGILTAISEHRGKMNTFLMTELYSVLGTPDNNELYAVMRVKEKENRIAYGTLVSQVKLLINDIRALEDK